MTLADIQAKMAFRSDEGGNVATIFALSLLPMMYLVGAGVDYGRALDAAGRLQGAVDQAALGAASLDAGARANSVAGVIAAAMAGSAVTTSAPVIDSPSSDTLTVTVTASTPTTILATLSIKSISVTRTATVKIPTAGSPSGVVRTVSGTSPSRTGCFLALDPTARLDFNVIAASSFDVSTCAAYASSDASTAEPAGLASWPASATGSTRYGAWYDSASGVSFSTVCSRAENNSGVVNGQNGCARIADPFAATLPAVTADPCMSSNTLPASSPSFTPAAPGTFCGFPTFTGSLPAGLYVIRAAQGDSAAKLTLDKASGAGVTFYVADETATIEIRNGASGLKAPSGGLYEGILMFMPSGFASRLVTWSGLVNDPGASAANPSLTGLVYAPSWNLRMSNWTNGYVASTIVADTLALDTFSGVTWRPGSRTIYVDNLGTATASFTTSGAPGAVAASTTSPWLAR